MEQQKQQRRGKQQRTHNAHINAFIKCTRQAWALAHTVHRWTVENKNIIYHGFPAEIYGISICGESWCLRTGKQTALDRSFKFRSLLHTANINPAFTIHSQKKCFIYYYPFIFEFIDICSFSELSLWHVQFWSASWNSKLGMCVDKIATFGFVRNQKYEFLFR